ncbi:MAG: dynamin family protein [Polaromonas sp.]
MSFNHAFEQHGAWRRESATRLKHLSQWMMEHDLLDAAVQERLGALESQLRSDKVMVAFVAEFSRGKSELINAIFFAGYGRRIMPASAGRTTMCPTELGYDAAIVPCLRLLPIETRRQPQSLMDWRSAPEKWQQVDLDVNDPAQLAQALEKVADVSLVTPDEALALGFWNDSQPQDNPPLRPDGLVEVPRWRHALINIAHPLLKQGLVILDTPGLNAVGAEPELTISLIAQAHAVVFILAADTGVTKSDLAIWREHLATAGDGQGTRLVVLNKIDTLWDALSTPAQVLAQIDRQKSTSAELLGLPDASVIAVSAQKGLVAKVKGDAALLQASQLSVLEQALSESVMAQRQSILHAAVVVGVGELNSAAARLLQVRRRDLAEQKMELGSLKGKNVTAIQQMRLRIEREKAEFSASGARIHAVRSVHQDQLRDVLALLGVPALKVELTELTTALRQPGIKLRLKKTYGETFAQLRQTLHRAGQLMAGIQAMLEPSFRQLNTEFGFSLQLPALPDITRHLQDLQQIEHSHLQYLGLGHVLRLAQAEFSSQLVRALGHRLRQVYALALDEVELWNKTASSQLDAQVRERRHSFARRLQAVERIEQASSGLDERIAELAYQEAGLQKLQSRLAELTSGLVAASATSSMSNPAALSPAPAAVPASPGVREVV